MKNMKFILSAFFLFSACLVLSGCNKKTEISQQKASIPKEQTKVEKKLINWMESGEAVECQIEIEEGKTITMMAKDGKIRMSGLPYASMSNPQEFNPENTDGVSLTSGEWVYTWSKESLEGVKFNMAEMEKLGEGLPEEQVQKSDTWEEQVRNWENSEIKYSCQKAQLADDLFVEPEGVEFVDMAEKMKDFSEMGKKFEMQNEGEMPSVEELKNLLPEGVEIPEVQ